MEGNTSYTWEIVVHNHDVGIDELLNAPTFNTPENAGMFAESYLYDRVLFLDGIKRLDVQVRGYDIFASDKIITQIINDPEITNFDSHFIVSRYERKGWVSSIKKVRVYMVPVTAIKNIEEISEVEEEEEYEERTQVKTVVPGRIYNSYKMEEMITTKKRPVKKHVTVTKIIESNTFERRTAIKDVLTVWSARRETINDEQEPDQRLGYTAPFFTNLFSIGYEMSDTCKTIQKTGKCIPSELKREHPKEFHAYVLKETALRRIREDGYHPLATVPKEEIKKVSGYLALGTLGAEIAEAAKRRFAKNKLE
jgi:hypothetical protein